MSNPLTNIVPGRYRKYVYAVLALLALGVSAWQAAGGDWLTFIVLLLGSLGFSTAASNITGE